MHPGEQVAEKALAVLDAADARAKAVAAQALSACHAACAPVACGPAIPPDRPARPVQPVLLPPGEMPKRRKGGTLANRVALIHAIAHIELNAIDLAADMVARFGHTMPADFTADWVQVASEEAKHFLLLDARLGALDSHYGALPAHDGLWQAAYTTRKDLAGRLAVVPMVLEARGLDVTPDMITRLQAAGDSETASILEIIYREEVGHVAIGSRWFHHVTGEEPGGGSKAFQKLVQTYFHGDLKPPFNKSARDQALLPEDYYSPLARYF